MPSDPAGCVLIVDAFEESARQTGLKLDLAVHEPIISWRRHQAGLTTPTGRTGKSSNAPPPTLASKLRTGTCGDASTAPRPEVIRRDPRSRWATNASRDNAALPAHHRAPWAASRNLDQHSRSTGLRRCATRNSTGGRRYATTGGEPPRFAASSAAAPRFRSGYHELTISIGEHRVPARALDRLPEPGLPAGVSGVRTRCRDRHQPLRTAIASATGAAATQPISKP